MYCGHIKPDKQDCMRLQFEDPSDARLSGEEARRKIMQRTLTGAALGAHQLLLSASACTFAHHETILWLRKVFTKYRPQYSAEARSSTAK